MGSENETNGYLGRDIWQQESRSYPPVYRQTWSYAVEHGELEEYRASRKLDEECKVTVEETFLQNYDGMHLNLDIVRPLAEQYGLERMTFILANTIQQASEDGSFSRDNRLWASGVSIDEDIVNGADRNRYLSIGIHPALLDGFISMFRREIPELEKENGRDFRTIQSGAVMDFRTKTNEQFHRISEMSPAEIEETVKCYVQGKLEEYGISAEIVDAVVGGSRCRGLERKGADLDVVVELSTQEREDALFDMLNEGGLYIGGVKVDISPITAQKTGTLETYLLQAEAYLEEVRKAKEYAVPHEKLKEFVKDYYGHYGDTVCTKKIAEALSVSIRRMIDTHQMENTRGAIEAVLDKDSTHEFIKSRQPNISPVPAEVIQAVDEYFGKASGLGNFTPVKICRISNDPGDYYLYAVVGYNLKTEEYACWTSWNHSAVSLNMGHYNLPDEQAALDIIRDRFNDISDEPRKYGMDHTLMSIKQPEIDNLRQIDQKQEQAGKIVHFSGRRGR